MSNVRTKRAIRKDMRQSVLHKVNSSSSSPLFQQLRPVIAPKRGKPASLTFALLGGV